MAYRGVTAPPTSFDDWDHLVTALANFAIARYGAEKVREWHFEVWNGACFLQPPREQA